MEVTELTVGPELATSVQPPKVKPAPEPKSLPIQSIYSKSEDGIDENLLIMLHGLGEYIAVHDIFKHLFVSLNEGDTEKPFANLARQLCLPQTATLSLRAPKR